MNLERFSKLFDLSGRVAVVTGATQGIGMACANALHDAGAVVIATDILQPDPEECGLYREITDRRFLDVTDEQAVKAMMQDINAQYGHLDILINNAGIMYKDSIDVLQLDRYKKVIETNLNGTVCCTRYAVPYMQAQHWGRVVNIASSQAFLATETYTAYAASKAAIAHLGRIWGNELAKDNVLINGLCPCFANTPMMEASISRMSDHLNTDYKGGLKHFEDKIPLGRILDISEIGNWAVALCSGLGDASTGSNFAITCGQVQL